MTRILAVCARPYNFQRGVDLVRHAVLGIVWLCAAFGLLSGCACGNGGGDAANSDNAVHINSIDPSSGTIGTEIVIIGSGFDGSANDVGFTLPGSASRSFNVGYQHRIPSSDGKTLRFTLQDTLGACAFTQMGPDVVCPAVGLMVPMVTTQAPLSLFGGALAAVGLLALGRFFLALAGLDPGSAFGGMGNCAGNSPALA